MLVPVYDKLTGETFLSHDLNAREVVAKSGFRYGLGPVCPASERITAREWEKHTGVKEVTAAPVAMKAMEGASLPLPGEVVESIDDLKAQIAALTARLDAEASDRGAATLEAAEADADGADTNLTPAQIEALDGDNDGKAGGSTARTPEEEAERVIVIQQLREKGITFFAGASTDKLKAKLAKG